MDDTVYRCCDIFVIGVLCSLQRKRYCFPTFVAEWQWCYR